MLGFFSLVGVAFFVHSAATTANYRRLRTDEVSKTVAFEGERVGKAIAEMERNAIDLALAGEHFFQSGGGRAQGISISVKNFDAFRAAVGGGIWFEPFSLDKNRRRVCYYAFYDPRAGTVRHDPEFETEEYDFHTQTWYEQIAARLQGKNRAVWTAPYFEEIGTVSLMTTVGAGIYDGGGRFVGMSTVDWQIQSMVDNLSAIRPTENSFVLLASPKDDYIISNTSGRDASKTGGSLATLPWYPNLRMSNGDSVGIGVFEQDGTGYMSFSRIFDNGWLFSVQIPSAEIFSEIERHNDRFTFIIAASSVLLLALASLLLSRLIARPLGKLTAGVAELGAGNLDKQLEVGSRDELGMLAGAFNKMTVSLKASIEEITRERAEKERIGAELNVAANIQASMLPRKFPPFPHIREFEVYATMRPAKEVGGDFYDFFLIDENTLAVVIADVSGKGVPAALFMVVAKTLIKNNAQSGKPPAETFAAVNNLLSEGNEANMFVTAFMGYLDIPSGRLTYVNAGHNPPALRSAGRYSFLEAAGCFVLGGYGNMPYTQGDIALAPGDELFLYTDGITEADNREKELFGEARLLEALNGPHARGLPIENIVHAVKAEVDAFAQGEEQADDMTVLALRYRGGQYQC